MMSWKKRALLVMTSVVLLQLVFFGCKLSGRINNVVNAYLGFKNTDVWEATSKDFVRNKWLEAYLQKRAVKVREVDCRKVLRGDKAEVQKANALEHHHKAVTRDIQILRWAGNCTNFVDRYGFLQDPLTRLEKGFSIAFSLIVFKQASQVVDLLRAVYRPQNWYCLHVDKKSPPRFRQTMEAVSRCFPNVYIASRAIDVRWGFYSVLESELVCMEDLWKNSTWKYFINLTGQEFPLRTNYELVRILSAFQGANDIGAFVPRQMTINHRWKKNLPTPHNITVYKGAVHIVASRGFVDYVLHAPQALAFREWCKKTYHPDEHFFNSLNHNPHLQVPGGGPGTIISDTPWRKIISASVARFKNWVPEFPCPGGKIIRAICILNILDLPLLYKQKELFANKFYADYSRLALRCLAEELHNRTTQQTLGRSNFNVTFYQQQPFVKNKLQ